MSTRHKEKHHDSPPPRVAPSEPLACFDATKADRAALAPEGLLSTRADVVGCVGVAIGASERLAALRAEISTLPGHVERLVDKLRTYAMAAWHAYLVCAPSAAPGRGAPAIVAEARPLREAMLGAAEAGVYKGLFPEAELVAIRAGKGNVDLANDLHALYLLYSTRWHLLEGKTAIDAADLARASALATELLACQGERAVPPPAEVSAAQDELARAYTLLVRAYEECRRAVAFLRWHEGDADAIAPSLFRRAPRRAKTAAPDDAAPAAADDAAPAPAPHGPGERPAPPAASSATGPIARPI